MNSIFGATSGGSSTSSLISRLNASGDSQAAKKPANPEVREKFQDFTAGTFYKEMLKALRQGQKHSKYFYGGQAEEIFRGQMDQQIAEDLARQHGGSFAAPLFDAFERQTAMASSSASSAPVSTSGATHAFDAVA